MEGGLNVREKDLAESRSVGCPLEVACAMSKGWHCWTGWHLCRVLEVTNLARVLEGTDRTIPHSPFLPVSYCHGGILKPLPFSAPSSCSLSLGETLLCNDINALT